MDGLYLWPDKPALSLLVLWLVSLVFLWAAREPLLQALRGVFKSLEGGLRAAAGACHDTASRLVERHREALLAAAEVELRGKIERELHRVDTGFSQKLGQYSELHRRLDDLILHMDEDYKKCGDSPPELPGWSGAVETVAALPAAADSNVKKVLEGIRESMRDAEKQALASYRSDTAQRHKILGRMRPDWQEVKKLAARIRDSVAKALETAAWVDRYVAEYEKVLKDREAAARVLTFSAFKPFVISLVVLGVALGGAFVNFQLIALPMSELVPAGARLGGIPVATVSALVVVLMEVAVGIFLMDMLGITDLFPKLASVGASRRRFILCMAFAGLFALAGVESSLAVLREQIVEADSALKLSLAGPTGAVVAQPANSSLPVVGQAVLGFVLPWILALVAIPLEMLIDSGRHVAGALTAFLLQAVGHALHVVSQVARAIATAIPFVYDVYISIPLRVERALRGGEDEAERRRARAQLTTGERRIRDAEALS